MKTLIQYLNISLFLLSATPGFGCHCDPPEFDFYKNILRSDLICLAICEGTGYDFQYNGLTAQTADFRVLDPMMLPLQQEGDTILVSGQDGLNCGETLTKFSAGDTVFLALGAGFYYEFGRDTFYLEGACGTYFFKVEGEKAGGLSIPQIKEKISYLKELKENSSYHMFHPHRELLFEGDNGNVRGLFVDSLRIDGEAHYYFNNNIRWSAEPGGCATPFGPSWSGRRVIIRANGDHIFFNRQGDSIRIRTLTNPGETWRAYEDPDYLIDAWVESSDTMSFLGVPDSVKTIRFRVYNYQYKEVDIGLNQLSVIISKNYGVIRLPGFYLFPDLEEISYVYRDYELASYDILGMTAPELGLQNFGWWEIFSFGVGDEFHILDEYRRIDQTGPSAFRETEQLKQTILKVIGAEYGYEELSYRIERRESLKEIIDDGAPCYTYIHDTVTRVYQPDASLGHAPDDAVTENERAYSVLMTNGPVPSKTIAPAGDIHNNPGDSCWSQVILCGCISDKIYYRGLGGPYGSCSGGLDSYVSHSIDLVYYSKSWGSWGSPLTFTGGESMETNTRLRIYPNPARDNIMISSDQLINVIRIIDNVGRVLFYSEESSFEQSISLYGLDPGIYLIGAETEGKVNWHRIIVL